MKETRSQKKLNNVDKLLSTIDYSKTAYANYKPSSFALQLALFKKAVSAEEPEEHPSPVMHYKMYDSFDSDDRAVANLCARGTAKTTSVEDTILFTQSKGGLPNFGSFRYGLFIGDTMNNGVKRMKRRLRYRLDNSSFLDSIFEETVINDDWWYTRTRDGIEMVYTGHSSENGPRGGVELRERPSIAFFDDLFSDKNSKSPKILSNIKDTVYSATSYALHPTRNKKIWQGTPFNARDPLYQAINSGTWQANVFPICEKFPCSKEEFRGVWEERFTWEYINDMYQESVGSRTLSAFHRELMLQIVHQDHKLINDEDIASIDRRVILKNKDKFNFYIITDFATTDNDSGDFSVIGVIAVNAAKHVILVDGICKKQTMTENTHDLLRLVHKYKPISVGIEVSGQQKGFISFIEEKAVTLGVHLEFAREVDPKSKRHGQIGFHPTNKKLDRFNVFLPTIQEMRFYVVTQLENTDLGIELFEELGLVTNEEIKSAHDDVIDILSMVPLMNLQYPMSSFDIESDSFVPKRRLGVDKLMHKMNDTSETEVESYYDEAFGSGVLDVYLGDDDF